MLVRFQPSMRRCQCLPMLPRSWGSPPGQPSTYGKHGQYPRWGRPRSFPRLHPFQLRYPCKQPHPGTTMTCLTGSSLQTRTLTQQLGCKHCRNPPQAALAWVQQTCAAQGQQEVNTIRAGASCEWRWQTIDCVDAPVSGWLPPGLHQLTELPAWEGHLCRAESAPLGWKLTAHSGDPDTGPVLIWLYQWHLPGATLKLLNQVGVQIYIRSTSPTGHKHHRGQK